jgi:hypothetical protein
VPAANLPWPSPVVIGEELVTNGTFDENADNWTLGGSSVYSSNAVDVNVPPVTVALEQTGFTPVIGKVYLVSYSITNYVSGGLRAQFAGFSTPFALSNGTITHVGVATSTSSLLTFINGGSAFEGTIDNISVKEINPLSVSIQMQGEMTYADEDSLSNVKFVDWTASTKYIRQYLRTDSTKTGMLYLLQNDGANLDVTSGLGLEYTPSVNVPFNIASRHGSTFINGAVDGTALTADTTPVALPDLSATDLELGFDYMGTISLFRVWADDLTDAGIAEASAPSTVPSLSLTFDGLSTSFTDGGLVV